MPGELFGLCSICGKPANETCSLCGKLVCERHGAGGTCRNCAGGRSGRSL